MNPSARKKAPAISASRRVELHLRNAIHEGKLRPRQRIIEVDLARELHVSRAPVREALLLLRNDGLIETTSRRGTFVRDISLGEIRIIFRMRGKLEGLCVKCMRENNSSDSPGLIRKALNRLKVATAKGSEKEFFRADMELHRTIWRAAQQPLLYRALNSIMNPYIFLIAHTYSSLVAPPDRRKSHEEYVEMILTTPVSRVERKIEQYWQNLYSGIFCQPVRFSSLAPDPWPDILGH